MVPDSGREKGGPDADPGQPEAGPWPGSAALPRRDVVRGFGVPGLAGAVRLVAAWRGAGRSAVQPGARAGGAG